MLVSGLRSATRSVRGAPGLSAIVVVTVATGIGLCTAVFAVLLGIAFPPMPYDAPARLVVLGATMNRQVRVATEWLTPEQLRLWRDAPPGAFAATSAFAYRSGSIQNAEGGTSRVEGAVVDGAFFRLLGVPPRIGRTIAAADADAQVIVLSEPFWRTHFGSDPDVLGHGIRLGSLTYSVIGVMPRAFNYPVNARYWTTATAPSGSETPGARLLARLADGVSFDAADAEIAARYDAAFRANSTRFGGLGVALERFRERERRITPGMLLVVAAGVAMVFLIALVNLSVLLLARSARRSHEFAIRAALGASPLRAIRPFVAELLVLTGTGAVCGIGIAAAATPIARALVPDYAESARQWSDPRVLGFATALTLLTALLIALEPVLRFRRFDVTAALRRGAAVPTATARERCARNLLVAAQVTLALALVAAAGIVAKSLANYRALDVGYDVERVVVATPEYDFDGWDDARQRQLGEAFLARFGTRGDIESAATWRYRASAWPPPQPHELFGIEGRESDVVPREYHLYSYYEVSPGFFRTLGIDILAGRDFQPSDALGAQAVAIIMESTARAWFAGEPALGRRVRIGPPGSEWLTVIGIVPDIQRISSIGRDMAVRRKQVYLPWLFRPVAQAGDTPPATFPRRRCLDCATLTMAVRLPERGVDRHAIARALAAELRTLAPDLPVEPGPLLEQHMNAWTPASLRRNRLALLAFATAATALALLGLHGIVAETVTRRTREIGIRVALGARERDIIGTVARQSIFTAAAGAGLGLLLLAVTTTATKQLFFGGGYPAMLADTSAADPYVLLPAAVLILLVAAATAVLAARRAAKLDPNAALRVD